MTFLLGVAIVILTVAAFVYSIPRGGKTARFVNTAWEGYVVVTMVAALGIGIIVAIAGLTELLV